MAEHRAPADADRRGPDFVQSLERGLSVIRAFGPDRRELTLSEVARATGLTRATARRFLRTLVALGYVGHDGRHFTLRPRVLELGYAFLSGLDLPQVAEPYVEELVAEVHESASVAVLDGDDVVYVVRVPTRRIMTVAISVGSRLPAYCTSMGRVLLAALAPAELDGYFARVHLRALTRRTTASERGLRRELGRVRHLGYALVDQEMEDGLIALAVPLHGADGSVVAAMNVSANALRVDATDLVESLLPPMRATAALIEDGLRNQTTGSSSQTPKTPWSAPTTSPTVA